MSLAPYDCWPYSKSNSILILTIDSALYKGDIFIWYSILSTDLSNQLFLLLHYLEYSIGSNWYGVEWLILNSEVNLLPATYRKIFLTKTTGQNPVADAEGCFQGSESLLLLNLKKKNHVKFGQNISK